MANIYVYDPKTGLISYSIDGATGAKVSNLKSRGVSFIVHEGIGMLNQYVTVDENGEATGVETINKFELTANKSSIVADGVDEIVFENVIEGASVYVGDSKVWTSTAEDTSFEFTVDGYNHQNPIVTFKKYGYYDLKIPVTTTPPPSAE